MLPSLLIGSVPTPALPFLLFLFPLQLFHFYYLCFHTCSSIFTVSAPTLALSFLLCQLPHLHFHFHCFCSNTCTYIFTVPAPTSAFPSLVFLLPPLYFHLYWLVLFPHLHFHFYCFYSHASFSIFTIYVSTPALPSLLFLHPHLHFHFYCVSSHTCTFISAVSAPIPALISPLLLLLLLHFHFPCSGFPRSGKTKNFQGQGKVREFFKKSGKIFDIVKVRKFCFPVYRSKLFFKTWNAFSLAKIKRMLQSKQSDQFDTLRLNVVVILWSLVFVVYDFLIIPSSLSAKSGKRLNMKRKMSMACKKN